LLEPLGARTFIVDAPLLDASLLDASLLDSPDVARNPVKRCF